MSRGTRLTEKECEFINVNMMWKSCGDIAELLGRNYYTVFNYIKKKRGVNNNHLYTPSDDAFIRLHFGKDMKGQDIADYIGVDKCSIYNRAKFLGVSKFKKSN